MNGNPRPRVPPNGMGGGGRPSNESRRPPGAPGGPPPPSSSGPQASNSAMSRAERFEDERRRITESCFAKLGRDGQLAESYITHIRIKEDAAYPQSPPPPESNPSNKKPRVIIIAVRSQGNVRLHKGRENANGTFSIGKTWDMIDVSKIENFVHLTPANEEEARKKRWARDVGFTVTINKPYYWEASTAKEKEFFIGSMVKIFHKYTTGRDKQGLYPALIGFSLAELNGLTNGQPQKATAEYLTAGLKALANKSGNAPPEGDPAIMSSPSLPQLSDTPPPPRGTPEARRPKPLGPPPGQGPPPNRPRRPDEDGFQGRADPPKSPRFPPPMRAEGDAPPRRPGTGDNDRRPPPLAGQRPPVPRPSMEGGLRNTPSRENLNMRPQPSQERMRRPPPLPTQSQQSQRLTPKSSRSELRPKTPDSASGVFPAALSPGRRPQADDARSQMSQRSYEDPAIFGGTAAPLEPRRADGRPSTGRRDPSPGGMRPGTAQSNGSAPFSRDGELASDEPLPRGGPPERRRPFMPPTPSQLSQRSMGSERSEPNTEFQTPTQSPQPTGAPIAVPPRRRPQETLDQSRPTTRDEPRPTPQSDLSRPEDIMSRSPLPPPPTSPLPQIPRAPEPKEASPVMEQPPAVEPPPAPPAPAPEPVPELTPAPTPSPVVEPTPVPAPVPAPEPTPESSQPELKATSPTEEEETHRPGLGPMVKKTPGGKVDAANAFRKAATAAGAFKAAGAFVPRAGGARAKFLAKDKAASDEPDGITGVFVPRRPAAKEEPEKKPEEESEVQAQPDRSSKEVPKIDTEVVPSVTVSSPLEPTLVPPAPEPTRSQPTSRSASPEREKPAAKVEPEAEVRRKRRRSNQQMMNISRLGIDPSILDGRGLEFESMLGELGWGSSELSAKNIEALESDIKREIARVEAGSWLNHLDQKDDRVEQVEKMLDRAIAECDEMEGLLTLYNVELSSLNDDIAFIEAQSQGLQVQTANQRLLQNELKQLVDTISITSDQLEPLRRAPIGKINGLIAIESSLVLLYKALVTIDPAFVEGSRAGSTTDLSKISSAPGFGNSELASMQALQEKKDRYLSEGAMFLDRLKKHMEITFGAAFLQTKDALANTDKTAMPSTKANIEAHDIGRRELWMLSPVVLFAKEIDRSSWDALLRMYQTQAGQIYQDEVRDNIQSWKRFARRPTGEEQELLFTAQEKETESITGAARKLTVKRSQTLARGLRSASNEKETKVNRTQDGRLFAYDVFSKVLDDIGPVLLTEQNFVTEFFHATSTDSVDFPEAVGTARPEERRGPNLWIRKQFEADRAMAKRVAEVMEDIFSFWPTEIQNMVEWAVKADPLQGVGILYAVDRKLLDIEDSNQDFLTRTLQKVHERLTGLFARFVDEQIRAIEDTKVKIKKRKGVIAFMKTFPHFSMAIENMLPSSEETDQLEIRRMVDDAYQKINKAMFESLKVIAKEPPTVMATQGQADPEDKEALNYHILLIENMNHYIEEVDARSDSVLIDWKSKAAAELHEHMSLYVDAVIRRPLGKLLEFVESTETLLTATSPQAISQRSSHSRSVFKKLVHSYDAKEIRKGIEALKKRVDKHFGDADDPSISRDLVFKVLKECETRYGDVYDRTIRINQDVYAGEVEMDWGPSEVTAAFRR
ncbi:hypothetical protein BS50DRAFT_514854 [Corynespora cassiicola Philippines]|uniref:Exocyst complex component Sec3 PIP2-binding N-terminal domain-containing protein n=1 Tax=Corynespora cassiicola Philippines TaxID=1448308 RepID=A0A2T2P7H7_CORCC|nr:hypothetical protein BS50DRAFT_514854 [Corynespora cassiicola Philippines]